jgi:hypothetical protein|tara:strand:- start:331 stop:528 length:198 start_codon:yes stop_codon:yes gene_type:complete
MVKVVGCLVHNAKTLVVDIVSITGQLLNLVGVDHIVITTMFLALAVLLHGFVVAVAAVVNMETLV